MPCLQQFWEKEGRKERIGRLFMYFGKGGDVGVVRYDLVRYGMVWYGMVLCKVMRWVTNKSYPGNFL